MSAAVVVEDLTKYYGEVHAVRGLSFTAPTGAVTAVLGPNGAGKTTTLAICEGLIARNSGHVEVLGLNPGTSAGRRALGPLVGVMPQSTGAPPGVRVAELLAAFAALYAQPLEGAELLGRLGLNEVSHRGVRTLSGGQQQRLSLALAVVGRPALLFLDEPTAGLDVQARLAVWDFVRDLRLAGVSIVVTTHLLDEAQNLADHVVIIDQGRSVAAGSVDELTGSVAQARFRAPEDLDLEDLAKHLPALNVTGSAGNYLVTGGVGPSALAALTAWAAHREITLLGLTVGPPTLEDVFLELTGRELRS